MPNREEVFGAKATEKRYKKAQKIIIFGALFAAIFVFIFSFILMTPFSDLYLVDGPFLYTRLIKFGITPNDIEALHLPDEAFFFGPQTGEKMGINLAYFTSLTRYQLQDFNHWLFAFGFFGLLVSLIPLVYFSQKRKIYYKTNLFVVPAAATFNLYIGVHMFVQLVMNQVLVLSPEAAFGYKMVNAYETCIRDNEATEIIEFYHQTDSNITFFIGYIVALAVIGFAVASYALTVSKYRYQKKQPPVDLSQVHINE